MRRVEDPAELETLFAADPETHLYGLADLEEPFWSNSIWFREKGAAVGLVSTGGPWVTGYAMSRVAPEETLALLSEVQGSLSPGTWITGPVGLYETVSGHRQTRDIGPHWRMILEQATEAEGADRAVVLGTSDVEALVDLHASDPGAAFFLPWMLERSPFVGIWENGRLVASAGTHVASERYGVAAVGAVIARPSHRGRGLGSAVMSALCRLLVDSYETIGLNVEVDNEPAVRLYASLGFRTVFRYEEVEVL